jgi:hypothetical protein
MNPDRIAEVLYNFDRKQFELPFNWSDLPREVQSRYLQRAEAVCDLIWEELLDE